jgi:hypothetical protein
LARFARASRTGAVRKMLPTWSARNGGLVRCMASSSICRHCEEARKSGLPDLRTIDADLG